MPDNRATLSVVIIAQDEESTIGDVIDSVKEIADEVILVDSGSTDRTIAIATSLNARIIHQRWLGFAAQKNFALSQATCQWILSLDADEILTPDLVSEIRLLLASEEKDQYAGYKISRLMYVGDKALNHGGFYPDAQLRLFRAGQGKFNDRLVHESVTVDGAVRSLRYHLLHRAYDSVEEFRQAHDKYARLAAQQARRGKPSKWKTGLLNLVFHPVWTFLYRYVGRAGFLDGILGLQMNLSYANYVRKKILYLREQCKVSRHES